MLSCISALRVNSNQANCARELGEKSAASKIASKPSRFKEFSRMAPLVPKFASLGAGRNTQFNEWEIYLLCLQISYTVNFILSSNQTLFIVLCTSTS